MSDAIKSKPMPDAMRRREGIVALLIGLVGGAAALLLASAPPPEVEIAGYATSLNGRTPGQRHNARRSVAALNGKVIPPGGVFSFNRIVKSWSWDQGYVKAPVSYDGELILAFGGGVCQTSTTLYNAALLAGLPIVERHPHVFAPRYVPPGRDAAVAQEHIDLRIRNPHPWQIRIRAEIRDDRLEVRLFGAEKPTATVQIVGEPLSVKTPTRLTRVLHQAGGSGRAYVRNPGATGYRIVSYRVFSEPGKTPRRERLSDDSYQAMDRLVQIVEPD